MVLHPGAALALLGLIRVALAVVITVGLFYLLIKLARLADAMTEAKRIATRPATS